MKKIIFSLVATMLAAVLLPTAACAQTINGDLNHSGKLEVSDVTRLISNYLTGTAETITGVVAPFGTDNGCILGTWYKSPTESLAFNSDGTTDYAVGYTYEFLPQGYILFYNTNGTLVHLERIIKATADSLTLLPLGSITPICYSAKQPVRITLSEASLSLQPDEYVRLTATVEPSDAGTVTWSSSDESVATVMNGIVLAVAEGTAIITAEVAGMAATCTVTVDTHELVDLGLPSGLKWATMNIGASSPEDYGDYFAWGETMPKTTYNWKTYKHCNGSYNTLVKYNNSGGYGTVDNKIVLDLSDDAARQNWGGAWRMPTDSEWTELRTECTWTLTTQNGVRGYKVVSKTNSNSIFLPLAGYRNDTSLLTAGSYGWYWSSSLYGVSPDRAWYVSLNSSGAGRDYSLRYYGRSVRPVCK